MGPKTTEGYFCCYVCYDWGEYWINFACVFALSSGWLLIECFALYLLCVLGMPCNLISIPVEKFCCLSRKGRAPNLYGNVLYMPLFGVFDWTVIFAPSMTDFQINKFCWERLGVWPTFGVKCMIFLEEFSSDMLRNGKLYFIYSSSLVFFCSCKEDLLSFCPLVYFYLHLNKISSFIEKIDKIERSFALPVRDFLISQLMPFSSPNTLFHTFLLLITNSNS